MIFNWQAYILCPFIEKEIKHWYVLPRKSYERQTTSHICKLIWSCTSCACAFLNAPFTMHWLSFAFLQGLHFLIQSQLHIPERSFKPIPSGYRKIVTLAFRLKHIFMWTPIKILDQSQCTICSDVKKWNVFPNYFSYFFILFILFANHKEYNFWFAYPTTTKLQFFTLAKVIGMRAFSGNLPPLWVSWRLRWPLHLRRFVDQNLLWRECLLSCRSETAYT